MNKHETALLQVYRSLKHEGRVALRDYADFLQQRYADEPVARTPEKIARPQQETVIAALKRLSATYPMINKDTMLHETSGLMAQHLLQGREAVAVIDELEVMFLRQYDALSANSGQEEDQQEDDSNA